MRLQRAPLRKTGEEKLRASPVPNHPIIPITESAMLIHIHATTDTPEALVEGLTETECHAIAETHAPYEGRIIRMG